MDIAGEIERLVALRDAGDLSEAEFNSAKRRLLGSDPAPASERPQQLAVHPGALADGGHVPAQDVARDGADLALGPRLVPYDGNGLGKLGKWVEWGLYAAAAVCAIGILSALTFHDAVANGSYVERREAAAWVEATMGWLTAAVFLLAPLYIVWSYRAHRQVAHLQARRLTTHSGWAIAGWIVPIAFLFMPYRVAKEAYTISGKRPDAVLVWWLLLIASRATFSIAGELPQTRMFLLTAFAFALTAAAGVMGARWVNVASAAVVKASQGTKVDPQVDAGDLRIDTHRLTREGLLKP